MAGSWAERILDILYRGHDWPLDDHTLLNLIADRLDEVDDATDELGARDNLKPVSRDWQEALRRIAEQLKEGN